MGKKDVCKVTKPSSLRIHKHLFTLNDLENKALERYLRTYRVQNKSKFIRETLMSAILRRFDEDAPTLFD
ncbi:MAG: hypothetical protein LWW91_01150 [Bacteroidales bacterium]|jgi:hypothetical protein|nr:hypothetical protein [Bacteroidales bacterium]ODT55994.1 MAG: hypothetical protein ABS72_02390 [Paludibacter sp. SCN 50-10]ODU61912.1 MAG: hypothetical protein ABT12_00205 [Paludibacter sp. SCN 51-9]OJX91232.1 MAG: hypothetical protein BGP01_12490 [Paludibacter sp. 47-17]